MKRISVFLGFMFAISFFSLLQAFDFSSDVLFKDKQNTMKGKMYISGLNTRMEMEGMIVISRMDKKVAWMIMPDQKMYMEHPLNRNMVVSEKFPDETERKLVGQETINGIKADKYLITVKSGNKTEQIYQWLAVSNGLPVKTSDVKGNWSMEMKNIKPGKQNPKLFEIPSGFNKMGTNGFMPMAPGK